MNARLDTCVRHLDGLDCPVHGPVRKKAPFESPVHQDPMVDPPVLRVRQEREVRAGLPNEHPGRVR
jgi:hypothetical protein